ncbi:MULTISPECIES: hypothetical protein [unclassified Exiguobacterium]|uniref:hypothetical protein n=1 Tax=unclassified Exiguobacterium TaxID=2644629 RepID=UPI001BEA4714|nr:MULTISPECIES: hypothetical protein [unclassified Exiguobacterium]
MPNPKKEKNNVLDASIFITLATALLYFLVYQYEITYIKNFGLDDFGIVTVSFSNFIKIASAIVITFMLIALTYIVLIVNLMNRTHPFAKLAFEYHAFFLMMLVLYFVQFKDNIFYFSVFFGSILLFVISVSWWNYRHIKGPKNKVEAYLNNKVINLSDIVHLISTSNVTKFVVLVVFLSFSLSIVSFLADTDTKNQTTFYVTEFKGESFVMIYAGNEKLLLAKFDNKTNTYTEEVIVVNVVSNNDTTMNLKKITVPDGIKLDK